METNKATHLADAINSNVERQLIVVLLDGNENLSNLCEKVHCIPIVDYIRAFLNNNDVPDAWIREAVKLYETGRSSLVIHKRDEDYYNKIVSDIRECLRYLMKFKGYKGYVVCGRLPQTHFKKFKIIKT